MSAKWIPIERGPVSSSCLSCPPRPFLLRYKDNPSPGFGYTAIYRDGERLACTSGGAATLIRQYRGWARVDPNHEWVIEIETPMTGVRYTRQASGRWHATHRSIGFA